MVEQEERTWLPEETMAPLHPPPRSLSPSSMAALLLSAGAVTVVAVCVSLVTVGVRYLFMRLLALHVFLEECLFKPLAHFLSHCFSIVF